MHSSRNLSTYLSVHPSASSCDSRAGTILSCPQVSPQDELKELWAQNNSVFTSAFETEPDWVFLVGHPSILTEFQPISGCCWLLSPFTVHHRTRNPYERKTFWTEIFFCFWFDLSLNFSPLLLSWLYVCSCQKSVANTIGNSVVWIQGAFEYLWDFVCFWPGMGREGGPHARQQLARCGHPEGG